MAFLRQKSVGPLAVAMALSLLLGFGLARGIHAKDDLRSQLDLFSQVLFLVQNNYVDVPDNEKLIRGAIDGMLKTLDPHTVYVPEKRAQRMDEEFHGEYSGIGIQFEIRDAAIMVISPLEGTPAYRLGLTAGDRIVEVDGDAIQDDITNEDVFRMLRGPAGSHVDVGVDRAGQAERLYFAIERAKIPIESVPYAFMVTPDVGYVRAIRFSQTTGQELSEAIVELREQGMKSLLLDLRSNSGGLLSQAVDVLDQLVPDDELLVYTRGRIPSANADYRSTNREKVDDLPLVVLIDHGSASASEIVAGAVQDLDRGLVAGTNSFGKGLVQNQLRLSNGSKLLLTIAKYHTPSGRLIQRGYEDKDRSQYAAEAFEIDVPTDSILATLPKFETTRGRTVYGGGGIYPDVLIKSGDPLTRPQIAMIQKRVFWEFATEYVRDHHSEKWTPASFGPDFELTGDEWSSLRGIMDKREVEVSDSLWTADRDFMLHQVRMEIANNAFGPTERYKLFLERDEQLHKALDQFPRASKLMSGVIDPTNKKRR